jgi:hypothetical protein
MAIDRKQTPPLPAPRLSRHIPRESRPKLPEQIVRLLLLGLALAYAYVLLRW